MAFTILPLKFSQSGQVLAAEPAEGTTRVSGGTAIDEMVRNAEQGFLLGGARGSGKTSLLQEVSLYVTRRLHNVVVLGPLSLSLVALQGLDSLGSQLRDWLLHNYARIPVSLLPVNTPEHSDSLKAWLPFLKKLIRERKADTLLLLLDDLESVHPEDRLPLLQDIQNSLRAKIGARVVLGCAGTLGEDESSLIPGDQTYDTDPAPVGKPSRPSPDYNDSDYGSDEVVQIKLKRYFGVELLNAMLINLGVAPPGKKSGKGKGLKTGKPLTSSPEPPVALPRYINHKFTKERTDKSPIDKSFALALDHEVYLRTNIGPFEKDTIIKIEEAQEFPSTEETDYWFPETKGKPLPLEATVFSNDFYVPERERTQKFMLERDGPTKPLYFPVTPRRKRSSRLRLCVFYRNHLLQSLSIEVDVRKRLEIARNPQRAKMEMSFSADFNGADQLPARGLWLGINQNADDTHTLNIKNSQTALSRNMPETKIETALSNARQALLDVSFELEEGEKVYRFDENNYPMAQGYDEPVEQFRDDLALLAAAGSDLYRAVFGFVPLAGTSEQTNTIVAEMENTLRLEQVIQVARLKRMEDIWPWAIMYDLPIDPDPEGVQDVCLSYRGKDGQPLSYAEGRGKCKHDEFDTTVVCPYGFWGFKHIIEQPTHPGGKEAFALENLVLEIKLGAEPVFEMLLENTLGAEQGEHIGSMKALNFKALTSLKEIMAAFNQASKPPPPEPHVMYFFCHGNYSRSKSPYLQVGTNEKLLPSVLDKLNFRWPNSRGLVFINGCHTAELQPKDLSLLMQPFLEAHASGIIGTEISVTTDLAREFADGFFDRFLADDNGNQDNCVGQIIKDLRLNLLMKYNPLGLVYTPYCSADLHVTR